MDIQNQETLSLEANKEHRFIITNSSKTLEVELLSGSAEIFGAEMIRNKIYTFPFSFAVSTLEGCKLKLNGDISRSYCVDRDSGIFNLHTTLESFRLSAQENGGPGPVTLIAGPTDVGKSTICRSLLNYASRIGRKPLFIDLDVGQSSLSIPGTMSVLRTESSCDVTSYDDKNLTVYYFGYKSPGINLLLYCRLIQRLGDTVRFRFESSRDVAVSGAVIDTCGWVNGQGYECLIDAAKSFAVNSVIVIHDRGLLSSLKKDLSPRIKIIFIPKLDGCVGRNPNQRRIKRDHLIHEYFYGVNNSLNPHLVQVKFSDIQIYKVESIKIKVDGMNLSKIKDFLSKVEITPSIINQVLGLSYIDDLKEDIISTSVLGFIKVQDVNMDKRKLTLLSPQPSPLPKRFLLMGDLRIETGGNLFKVSHES